MSQQDSVSVLVVNWNGGKALLESLASIFAQSRPPDEVILVDNASVDGSFEAAVSRFSDLRASRNQTNLGFGHGVNRAARMASSDWLVLLNNDAVADREWLANMLKAGSRPHVGMVACKVYLDRGRGILDKVGHRIAVDGQNYGRAHCFVDDGRYDHITEVCWPDGCAAMYRRAAFEHLGGIDEEFFAYADDADLGIRFRLAGWRCAFAPNAIVEHRHSQTLGAYSPQKLFLVERNRIWLAAKYFPLRALALNPLYWVWRGALTICAQRMGKGPWAQVPNATRAAVAKAILRGQLAGWAGVPRQLKKRRKLDRLVGPGWHNRFERIFAEARISLIELAIGDVR